MTIDEITEHQLTGLRTERNSLSARVGFAAPGAAQARARISDIDEQIAYLIEHGHEHDYGPMQHGIFTGEPSRPCRLCNFMTLDLDDQCEREGCFEFAWYLAGAYPNRVPVCSDHAIEAEAAGLKLVEIEREED